MLPRDFVKRCARNYPTKTAYLCGERSRSWREMDQRSDRFGVALQQLGHRAGEAVAILTQESIEVYEHFFACMKIAAPRVGLNTGYVWPEMLHVLKDSEVKFLLLDTRCRHLVAERLDELKALGITLIGYGTGHGLERDYESLLAKAEGEPHWPALAPDDILFVSYTSGTTGVPKGVMLPQQSSILNCGFGEPAAIATKNYKQLGITVPHYGTHALASDVFVKLAAGAAEDMIMTNGPILVWDQLPTSDPQQPVVQAYVKAYRAKFNEAPSFFAGNAHDAFFAIREAVRRSGSIEPAKIRDAIEKGNDFVGVTGHFRMNETDHVGLTPDSLRIVQVKNGRWKLVE